MPYNKIKAKEPVQCKICNATVQKGSLNKHLQIHKERRFPCDICGVYKAKRKDTLDRHKIVVHNVGEESIHDCLFCQKNLCSYAKLKIHLRSHTQERPFFCKFCRYECTTAEYCQIHTRRIHSSQQKPVFHCPTCSKGFFDKHCLTSHLKIHVVSVEDLQFKCDVCSKPFPNRTRLTIHKRVHSNEQPFQCEVCNLAFAQEAHRNVHLRVHTGEKPFTCTVCKKRFAHSSNLKVHMRMHSGEKPYACAVCQKRFAQIPHLKRHERIHSGEKPHACRECNVSYSDRRSLQAHLKRSH